MISDDAVDAAAKAVHDEFCREDWHLGKEIGQACYDFKAEARTILEAAAPHILSALAEARESDGCYRFIPSQRSWLTNSETSRP